MKYNFDEIIPRRGTNSYKWDSAEDADVLPIHLYSIFIFRGRYFSKKHYFQEHPLFFRGISSKNI